MTDQPSKAKTEPMTNHQNLFKSVHALHGENLSTKGKSLNEAGCRSLKNSQFFMYVFTLKTLRL
jgi:hypothetical protein